MKKPPIPTYIAHQAQPKTTNWGLIAFLVVAAIITFYLINKNSKDEV